LSDVWLSSLFSLGTISFVCKNFLVLYTPIYPFFLLVAELLGFYWGSSCLHVLFPECFLLFPVPTSEFWVWY
jgi:hypothetical protein